MGLYFIIQYTIVSRNSECYIFSRVRQEIDLFMINIATFFRSLLWYLIGYICSTNGQRNFINGSEPDGLGCTHGEMVRGQYAIQSPALRSNLLLPPWQSRINPLFEI